MEADAVAQSLAFRIDSILYSLLVGRPTDAALQADGDEAGFAQWAAVVATVPPVLDPAWDEVSTSATDAVRSGVRATAIALRDASGAPVMSVEFGWTDPVEIVPGMPEFGVTVRAATRHDGVPLCTTRSPDAAGRLPNEQFVGSPGVRLARLFAALPAGFDDLERPPASDGERAFRLQYADADIHNGGFHQFYSNSSGNFAGQFPDFADRVGATAKSSLIRTANGMFDPLNLHDRNERIATLDTLPETAHERLDELTNSYYGIDEDLTGLLVGFIERSPDDFLC